ncbi:MAG: hypothetical protein QM784_37070 [Polyangiaceae bacterium]
MRIVRLWVLSACLSSFVTSFGCSGTDLPPAVSTSGGQVGIVFWPIELRTGKNRILAAIVLRDPSTSDVKLLRDGTTELQVTFTKKGSTSSVSAVTGMTETVEKTQMPLGSLGRVPYSHFVDVEFSQAGVWVANIIVRSSSIPSPLSQSVELTVVPQEENTPVTPL